MIESTATTFFHLSSNCQIPPRKNDVFLEVIPESIHYLMSS